MAFKDVRVFNKQSWNSQQGLTVTAQSHLTPDLGDSNLNHETYKRVSGRR